MGGAICVNEKHGASKQAFGKITFATTVEHNCVFALFINHLFIPLLFPSPGESINFSPFIDRFIKNVSSIFNQLILALVGFAPFRLKVFHEGKLPVSMTGTQALSVGRRNKSLKFPTGNEKRKELELSPERAVSLSCSH